MERLTQTLLLFQYPAVFARFSGVSPLALGLVSVRRSRAAAVVSASSRGDAFTYQLQTLSQRRGAGKSLLGALAQELWCCTTTTDIASTTPPLWCEAGDDARGQAIDVPACLRSFVPSFAPAFLKKKKTLVAEFWICVGVWCAEQPGLVLVAAHAVNGHR